MKYIKFTLLIIIGLITAISCKEERLEAESIFDTETDTQPNALDEWIIKTYTQPYNIRINYKFVDNETNISKNVDPAKEECAKVLLYYINHVWIESFNELLGKDFMKNHSPRMFQLIGSSEYNTHDGSETLGIAEGGVKITLTNVNIADPKAERNKTYWKRLNKYCFHVIFHEFSHILHQTKNYSTDFNLISVADYKAGDWVNLSNADAPQSGFISGYASKEANEDFVELIAFYLTEKPDEFTARVNQGLIEVNEGNPGQNDIIEIDGKKYDTKQVKKIYNKLAIVKDYMSGNWNIDMDKLRDIVGRRMDELKKINVETL